MQDVNNDMDDLFQRAAENYPLRVGDGDWESIARTIADEPASSNVILAPAKKGNKKIIALVLLLLIGSFGWYILQKPSNKISRENSNELTKSKDGTPGKSGIRIDHPGTKKESQENDILGQNNSRNKRGSASFNTQEAKLVKTSKDKVFPYMYTIKTMGKDKLANGIATKKPHENYGMYYTWFFSEDDFSKRENQGIIENLEKNATAIIDPVKKNVRLPGEVSIAEKHAVNSLLKKKPSARINKSGVYVGLIAGPDLSKVHSTPFNFGFDIGLLLGYKISPRLSVESGLIKGKKNYTSDGSNFNMSKVRQSMPSGMTINDLASQSNLIEIPVKVKYSFTPKKKSGFFVAGGLSSYIMTKEKNLYNTSVNGNPEKFNGVYNKNNYRFPADINISAGYEHSISSNLNFKIEPFLKIPLQGVGVGSLPVTSTGLQLGITRRLK